MSASQASVAAANNDLHVAFALVKSEHPDWKAGFPEALARISLDRGERMVRVFTERPWGSSVDHTAFAPIHSWDEYVRVRDWPGTILTYSDARLIYGWKGAGEQKPDTYQTKLDAATEDIRVQAAAKRIVSAEQNPIEPLALKSVAELLSAPAPEWWIDGVLPKDAIVVVGGDGGVGKSATLVELTARLSTGTPFLGRFAARKATVLYCVGEGMSGYGPRFEAVGNAHGLDPNQVRLVATGVNLTSDRSIEQVRRVVQESKVDVVVFDTLSSLSTLVSENDAAEVGRLIGNAKKVREANPGCTVIIVHHTNKASGGLRGSSVIRDNADVVWMLRGDPDAFFMSTKAKHGGKVKDGDPLEIHGLSLVPSGKSIVVESAQGPMESGSSAAKRARGVAEQLTDERVYSTAEMREIIRAVDTGASETTIKRTLTELVSDAVLVSEARGQYRAAKVHPAGGPMAPSA